MKVKVSQKGAPPTTARTISLRPGEKRVPVAVATAVRDLVVALAEDPQLVSVKRRGDLGPAILDAAAVGGQEFLLAYPLCWGGRGRVGAPGAPR